VKIGGGNAIVQNITSIAASIGLDVSYPQAKLMSPSQLLLAPQRLRNHSSIFKVFNRMRNLRSSNSCSTTRNVSAST